MEVIKSYKLTFDDRKMRVLTNIKRTLISDFSSKYKQLTNFIFKENSLGYNYWQNMSKDDISFVRHHYEKEFQLDHNLKSTYSQNIYRFANSKYIDTLKSLKSDYIKNQRVGKGCKTYGFKKVKPYIENHIEFPLDNRMLSKSNSFIKDESIDNLYWLSIINPFKNNGYKVNVNLPLFVYPEVQDLIDKGYKYSFAIHKDYVKITFKYEIKDKIISTFNKESKKLNIISIDFGKYLSTFDGTSNNQYDLHRMYNKINKLQLRIKDIQGRIDIMKNNGNFGIDYKQLKSDLLSLHKKIKDIRKSTYGFVSNRIIENNDIIIVEDLTFTTIPKKIDKDGINKDGIKIKNPKYKGRRFNKMINVMGKGIWLEILENKVKVTGSEINKVNSSYTSQECSQCGNIDKKARNGRFYRCKYCGHKGDADKNASIVIFKRWQNVYNIKKYNGEKC